MNKVLLIDDHPQSGSHHIAIFGKDADVCRSVDELKTKIDRGDEWSAAFVDFDLSGTDKTERRTGLGVLALLRTHRPDTRRVVYTTLSDNGRALFAVAAYRWLDTNVILDKSGGDPLPMRQAADPLAPNPTPKGWQQLLTEANRIDYLFAEYNWLDLWRIWWSVNGSVKSAASKLGQGHTPNSVKRFANLATGACLAFQEHFFSRSPELRGPGNTARATPLASFAYGNDKFFNAEDLPAVLAVARPWDTVRAAAELTRPPAARRKATTPSKGRSR